MRVSFGRTVFAGVLALGLLASCGSSGPIQLSYGAACVPGDSATECTNGLCVALDSQSGFCTRTCNDDCPADSVCEAAGRFGRICRPLTGCKTEVDCPAGHVCNAETGNCYIAVSRSLCSPCQDVSQCPASGACFKAIGSGEQFCTTACDASGGCPTGFACKDTPVGKENALVKQCVPVSESCNQGRPLCAACQGDNECGGPADLCVRNVVSGERFCGRDCNPAKNVCPANMSGCDPASLDTAANPECPTGFSCVNLALNPPALGRGPYQCVPNSNSCQGYCDATTEAGQRSQCGIGKVCTNNTCQPATDGRMCSACSDNDDCRAGGFTENRCITNNCTNCPYQGESFCSTPCADDGACVKSFGVGFVCKAVQDPSGAMLSYCMPQRGSCANGLHQLGEDCSANGGKDCITGLCLVAGLSPFCSNACSADSDCADGRFRCCDKNATGTGYDCSAEHRSGEGPKSGSGVCAPTGGLFGDDCAPGQAPCQSGTCLDLGTARVCTVTCAGGSACPSGFTCRKAQVPGATGTTDVCFPNGGGKAGGSCSFGPAACESGLCIRKDSGNICTQSCTAASDCPANWACELTLSVTAQSVQACIPPALTEG